MDNDSSYMQLIDRPSNAIKFLENQDLERDTFCEQKAFPLKLSLQKNFKHLEWTFSFVET